MSKPDGARDDIGTQRRLRRRDAADQHPSDGFHPQSLATGPQLHRRGAQGLRHRVGHLQPRRDILCTTRGRLIVQDTADPHARRRLRPVVLGRPAQRL